MFNNFNIDFLTKRKYAYILSSLIILAGIVSLVLKGGPKLGIDFTGGTLVQLNFKDKVTNQELEEGLSKAGINVSEIQNFVNTNTISFKFKESNQISEKKLNEIKEILKKDFIVEKIEIVGPAVGTWLIKRAFLAFILAFIGIIIYVGFRFSAGFWGVAGVIALLHDVFVVIAYFSIFNLEIDLTIVAALMTIVGYSINDTIVIYDRIRENMRVRYKDGWWKVINDSINETLSRTIITSGVTILTVICLLVFAGGSLKYFSLALFVGMISGVYSTVFIAIPIVIDFKGIGKNKENKSNVNISNNVDLKGKIKVKSK
jgi:preprotein translocase subunit SecF